MIDCSKIPYTDKGCHFIAGFIIAIVFTFTLNPLWGLVMGVVAGIIKEAYDEYRYGGGDFFDVFATVVGTFAGVVLSDIIW